MLSESQQQQQSLTTSIENTAGLVYQDVSFDPNKLFSCTIENGDILVHGSGGRGYGLAAMAITSGCYMWKVGINIPD